MQHMKIYLVTSLMIVFFTVTINSCEFTNKEFDSNNNVMGDTCKKLIGSWNVFILNNREEKWICKDNDCGSPMRYMVLECIDNKIVGKYMTGYNSKIDKDYWTEFETIINDDNIYFEFNNQSDAKSHYTIKEIKENRLFGDFILRWANGKVAQKGNFVAIKQNETSENR